MIWPSRWLVVLFGRMIANGYANCVIFSLWKYWTCGGKIVMQRTQRNRIRWVVWFHVKWKPAKCPYTGHCPEEESFEPIDGPDVIFPPILFRGKVVKGG
jgi:hypothetical protein